MIQKIDVKEIDKLMETGSYAYFCDMGFVPGHNYKDLPTDPVIVDGVNGFFVVNESDLERDNGFLIKLSEKAKEITGGFAKMFNDNELEAME